jgi:hypothetical protein
MSINPDHINQLAAILREVDGSHTKGAADLAQAILSHPGSMWQPPDSLAQPEGEDGPSLADVDDLCAEFQFHYDNDQGETLEILQEMIGAALARWGRPAALAQPEGEGPGLAKIDEKELLRVYCNARRAYCHDGPEHINWQRDAERGATLAGLGAVLTRWGRLATPPAPEVGEQQRNAVIEAVTEALGDAYDCLRVWEAWGVGTMGEDDFELVAENGERVAEIADAAIEAMRPTAAPPAPEVGEAGEVGEVVDGLRRLGRYAMDKGSDNGDWLDAAVELDRAATLLQQQQHLLSLAGAELDRMMQQQQAAPAPVVVPVADRAHQSRRSSRSLLEGD